MLRLSELSGFIVRGYHLGKIYGKISPENPFPSKLWGGVIGGVAVYAQNI